MPASEFQRVCQNMQLIGDSLSISVDKEGITFAGESDIGRGSTTVRQHASADKPETDVVVEMSEPIQLAFALRYLNLIAKAAPLSSQVALSFVEGQPMMVEFQIGSNSGSIRYFLAPKISEDDSDGDDEMED